MADTKISALPASTTPLVGTEVLPIVQGGATKQVSVTNLTAGRTISASSLGLGISTPSYILDVRGGATANVAAFSSTDTTAYNPSGYNGAKARMFFNGNGAIGATLGIEFSGTGNNENYFGIVQESGGAGAFVFQGYNGTAYVERARFGSDSNLTFGVAAKGINFTANTPAAGMTSQLLNWYEEGTWTPTDASGAGLTFTVTFAKYTRVGKQVTVNMFITFPSTASAAQANIGGLPFNIASNNYPPVTLASNSGVALSGIAAAVTKTFAIGTAADYSSAVANSTLSGRNLVASLTYLVD